MNGANGFRKISVVICTYDRLSLLKRCLASLDSQTTSSDRFDVLIVDNNSRDGTAEWVKSELPRHSNWRYFFESAQGLSHARNRGWREAKEQYVAFLDDDGVADPNWIAGILETLDREKGALAAAGGPYFPFYIDPKPAWFDDRFGTWDGGREIREYRGGECICGGNMVLKREVLEKVGGFSPEFGMTGNVRAFGEETQVHLRIKALGLPTRYSPLFPILHLVKASQFEPRNLLADAFRAGRNAGQLGLTGRSRLISAAKVFVTLLLQPYYYLRYSGLRPKARILHGLLPLWRRFGYFTGLCGSA